MVFVSSWEARVNSYEGFVSICVTSGCLCVRFGSSEWVLQCVGVAPAEARVFIDQPLLHGSCRSEAPNATVDGLCVERWPFGEESRSETTSVAVCELGLEAGRRRR